MNEPLPMVSDPPNVSKAAKLAGKYRADVYELIKKYNLKITDFRNK